MDLYSNNPKLFLNQYPVPSKLHEAPSCGVGSVAAVKLKRPASIYIRKIAKNAFSTEDCLIF